MLIVETLGRADVIPVIVIERLASEAAQQVTGRKG